jgi:hypothetical protein
LNPEEPNIFSPSIMRRKFVEYLCDDCIHFCRIPVELSVVSMWKTKCTKRSSKKPHIAYTVHDERGGRGSICHLFLPIYPQENNEKMVSGSEPSNLRKK